MGDCIRDSGCRLPPFYSEIVSSALLHLDITCSQTYYLLYMESKTQQDPRDRLREVFSKFGGSLTFRYTASNEGWLAECNEVPGIFTGAPNPAPTFTEIDALVRDAIFAAFDVVPAEGLELKRTVRADLKNLSVNITQPILRANELVAVLGKNTEFAHA